MTLGQRRRIMEALRDNFRKNAREFERRFYEGEWDDDIRAGKKLGVQAVVDPGKLVNIDIEPPTETLN